MNELNWVPAAGDTLELWPVLVWELGCSGEQWELRAQRPSQVLPTQAHFTSFCAILTAQTLHIVWVCAIKVELGLFVFTLNIFFDDTGPYLCYL